MIGGRAQDIIFTSGGTEVPSPSLVGLELHASAREGGSLLACSF